MSFSGAGPYLTCFSIPVPSLVPGAKIFPRSACCMNEDKVFAWKSESISDSIMSDSFAIPWTVSCQAPCPWSSPGKDTGVGSCSLFQGIFLTQGWNPGLLHFRQILYYLRTIEALKIWTDLKMNLVTQRTAASAKAVCSYRWNCFLLSYKLCKMESGNKQWPKSYNETKQFFGLSGFDGPNRPVTTTCILSPFQSMDTV